MGPSIRGGGAGMCGLDGKEERKERKKGMERTSEDAML